MLEDSNDDYKKARSNLIIISTAVIIYIYGGGSFNHAALFGGSMSFSNPNTLPTVGVLMFIFILWRFSLLSGNSVREFRWDVWTLFYTSKTYKDIRDKLISDEENFTPPEISRFATRSVFDVDEMGEGYFPPRYNIHIFSPSLVYKDHAPVDHSRQNYYPFYSHTKDIRNIKISNYDNLSLMIIQAACFIRAIFFKRGFSDVIFPILMGVSAAILLIPRVY